ncbi:MAG: carboxypeptidase regulatory-like domain-containing protein [Saprospiraceae bacterium]|nr:carboxypeptidase regulatory-like domain-containing protein [Saprospiraceae bacterium]
MKNWKLPLLLLLLSSATWFACDRDDLQSAGPMADVTFTGRITNESGEALYGATVRAGDQSATADVNGVFQLKKVRLSSRNAILYVSQPGYFEFSRAYVVENGSLQTVSIQLLKKNPVHSFLASQSSVAQTAGAKLSFPANSIVKADGSAYSGIVDVYARYLDPTSPDLHQQMPGDLRGISAGGEEQTLATFGMLGVELITPGDELLNIAPGQEVEISMPIPAEKLAAAPAEIALWHYDVETARWIEEGAAQKVGNNYVGKVKHFSFWNCDDGMPLVNLSGKVFLGNNETPLTNAQVRLTIVSSGYVGFSYTDANGCFGGGVPKDETFVLEVLMYDQCGYQSIFTQTIGPFSSDATLPPIIVPTININYVTLSGRLVDCNQQPLATGYVLLSSNNYDQFVPVANDGTFSKTLVLCSTNPLSIIGYDPVTQKESVALNYPNPTGTIQTGDIQVCTNISEFVNVVINGQNYSFISAIEASKDGEWFLVWAQTDQKSVNFSLKNYGQTGTFPLEYFNFYPVADSVANFNINTTISTFGPNVGDKVIGTLSGSIEYQNGQTVPVLGTYQVNRDH